MVEIFTLDFDEVIKSRYLTGKTNFQFAIENFIPLVDRLDIQRKGQSPKFYSRLEEDLLEGCIMPPITLAFIDLKIPRNATKENIQGIVNKNISNAFILDGLQRLRTLSRASSRKDVTLDITRPIFLNILLCDSMDKLLYRMITLNNGQKPMTARHQIEIVASNLYNFSDSNLAIQTEKERSKKIIVGSFKRADFIKGYLAYLSKSINIDNAKIIEQKLDELIADKILDTNIAEEKNEFSDVVELIGTLVKKSSYLTKWFKNVNNLVAFSAGISQSYEEIKSLPAEEFEGTIRVFEEALEYFDVSKIRVGDIRRKSLMYFIINFSALSSLSTTELIDELSQQV